MEASTILAAAARAAERFNEWMMGDLVAEVVEVRGNVVRLLVKQECACSLDFSLKEEIENAFREEGLEVEVEVEEWDVEEGGYRVTVRVRGAS